MLFLTVFFSLILTEVMAAQNLKEMEKMHSLVLIICPIILTMDLFPFGK